jgi:4-amino-4-deoxy-L-arabinose transferase-like glycosyltransferase
MTKLSLVGYKNNYFKCLIVLCIVFNAVGLFFPILRNDDPTLYASIAKNIILSGNWLSLFHPLSVDWLDKPHLQFWLTAISFKIFGVTSFAYMLPGFLFHLLGAYYTYRLARLLFDKSIGLLSALIYLSSFHLLLSATVDVRAEAYLCGMIMAACYYYLKLFSYSQFKLKPLLIATIMTSCAIMTKGIFVTITIASGVMLIIYQQIFYAKAVKPSQIIVRLILAVILTGLFISPELWALYVQFDLHPEKIIFNTSHVSGIKWFLWDSQIGRFFNTGQITRHDPLGYGHYLFFVPTFLWSFLPWSIVFLAGLISIIKNRGYYYPFNLLLSWFFVTFIVFSLSKFQLDYYTNILIPFAAIISAVWLNNQSINIATANRVIKFQIYLSVILVLIAFILGGYILSGLYQLALLTLAVIVLTWFFRLSHNDNWYKAITFSVVTINSIFVVIMLIYGSIYTQYDIGYNVATYLNKQNYTQKVISYKFNSLTLEFYLKNGYNNADNKSQLAKFNGRLYIVSPITNLAELRDYYGKRMQVERYFSDMTIDKLLKNILERERLNRLSNQYVLIKVN